MNKYTTATYAWRTFAQQVFTLQRLTTPLHGQCQPNKIFSAAFQSFLIANQYRQGYIFIAIYQIGVHAMKTRDQFFLPEMNLELLDPFELQDFPEVIKDSIEDGYLLQTKLNGRGSLLAASCNDGRAVILDFDTRSVATTLLGHIRPVTAISWSFSGRYLLTVSKDWNAIVWEIVNGCRKTTIRLDTPLLYGHFHPFDEHILMIIPAGRDPLLVDCSSKVHIEKCFDLKEFSGQAENFIVGGFGRDGRTIILGTSKGELFRFDYTTLSVVAKWKIGANNVQIKQIEFTRDSLIAVNATDRIIRLYDLKQSTETEPYLVTKFQDLINRTLWSSVCFSPDGEYLVAGSSHNHNIYIWNTSLGNLAKILEGPKEPVEHVTWHPVYPIIISVSSYGIIYIWKKNTTQNWSAFAPGFKELEENVEYMEKETEFDMMPEEEIHNRKQRDEDPFVDVCALPPDPHAHLFARNRTDYSISSDWVDIVAVPITSQDFLTQGDEPGDDISRPTSSLSVAEEYAMNRKKIHRIR